MVDANAHQNSALLCRGTPPASRRKSLNMSGKGGDKSGGGKKRKIQFSENENSGTGQASRRDIHREIAERRAAHFARADPSDRSRLSEAARLSNRLAPVSSTPTGFLRKPVQTVREDHGHDNETENNEEEAWPGPFSTAHTIMAKREAAKKARDELIASRSAKERSSLSAADSADLDEYDKALYSLDWPPAGDNERNNAGHMKQSLPSLSTICAAVLARHFDGLSGEDLSLLQLLEREILAVELSKLRLCGPEAALKLAVLHSQYLVLPECSELDEDCLIRAMEQAAGVSRRLEPEGGDDDEAALEGTGAAKKGGKKKGGVAAGAEDGASASQKGRKKKSAVVSEPEPEPVVDGATDPSLTVLRLGNCGWGMTDRAAAVCIGLVRGGLEVLQLAGCYRLNDTALSGLLVSCRESLLSLDLSCNSRLSGSALAVIRTLTNLEELVLDNCTQLTDADLLQLLPDPTALTASGSSGISSSSSSSSRAADPSACPPLLLLSLEGLIEVTDASVLPLLARYGPALQALSVSGCVLLTDRTLHCLRRCCGSLRSLGLGQLGEVSTAAMLGLFIMHPSLQHGDQNHHAAPPPTAAPATAAEQARALLVLGSPTDELSASPRIGHLEFVCLQGTACVTDDVVVQLCESNKRTLTALNLNGCHQLTGRAIMALHANCRRSLRTLDVSFVRGFSQEALGTLVDACVACDSLQLLTVWGCTQLGDKFWKGYRRDSNLQVVGKMTA